MEVLQLSDVDVKLFNFFRFTQTLFTFSLNEYKRLLQQMAHRYSH